MQLNKKYAAVLSIGALLGTAGVVALQTHAQQTASPASMQSQAVTPAPSNATASQDTDNIQYPGGVEKPGAPDPTSVKANDTDQETNDDQSQKQTVPDNDKEVQDDTSSSATN